MGLLGGLGLSGPERASAAEKKKAFRIGGRDGGWAGFRLFLVSPV